MVPPDPSAAAEVMAEALAGAEAIPGLVPVALAAGTEAGVANAAADSIAAVDRAGPPVAAGSDEYLGCVAPQVSRYGANSPSIASCNAGRIC